MDGRSGHDLKYLLSAMLEADGKEMADILQETVPILIKNYKLCKLTFVSIPILVDIMFQKKVNEMIMLIDFIGIIKTFAHGFDMSTLDRETYRAYYDSIFQVQEFCKNFMNVHDLGKLKKEDKSMFCVTYLSIMSFSKDAYAFLLNKPFDQAFHVKCPECGNDIHSLYISIEKNDISSQIKPVFKDFKEWDGLDYEDVYLWFGSFLNRIGEIYYLKLLPYLYGTNRCSVCGKKYIVMEGIKNYLTEYVQEAARPSKEEAQFVLETAEALMLEGEYEKALCYCRLALSFEKDTNAAAVYLLIGSCYNFLHKYGKERCSIQKAVDLLERNGNCHAELAEAYKRLGNAYSADYENEDNNDYEKAVSCYQKSIEIYNDEFGEGSKHSNGVYYNLALLYADGLKDGEKSIFLLKKLLDSMEGESFWEEEEIAEYNKTISYVYEEYMKEYDKAIHYYKVYLEYVMKEYGENSEIAADCYREFAELYEKQGEAETAAEFYECALKINIDEMGKVYILPPVFKKAGTRVLKLSKKEQNPMDLMHRSMSAAESYDDIGDLYFGKENFKKAIKCYEKALALREWVFRNPVRECGDSHYKLAELYRELGNNKELIKEYTAALRVYHQVMLEGYESGHPIVIEDAEVCREKAIEICRELWYLDAGNEEFLQHMGYELLDQIKCPMLAFDLMPQETAKLQSKLGGLPFMNKGFIWPSVTKEIGNAEPLRFVLQVNFADIPKSKDFSEYPPEGILQLYISRHILKEMEETELLNRGRQLVPNTYFQFVYYDVSEMNGSDFEGDTVIEKEQLLPCSYFLSPKRTAAYLGKKDIRFEKEIKEGFCLLAGDLEAEIPGSLIEYILKYNRDGGEEICIGGSYSIEEETEQKLQDEIPFLQFSLNLLNSDSKNHKWADSRMSFFIKPGDLKNKDFSHVAGICKMNL